MGAVWAFQGESVIGLMHIFNQGREFRPVEQWIARTILRYARYMGVLKYYIEILKTEKWNIFPNIKYNT